MSLLDYLRLTRLQSAPLGAMVFVVGGIIGTGGLFDWRILALFLLGYFVHLVMFTSNELLDAEADRLAGLDKPATRINTNTGWLLCVFGAVVIFSLVQLLSYYSYLEQFFVLLAIFMSIFYNWISKSHVLAGLMLSIPTFFFFIYGVIVTGGVINNKVIILGLVIFLYMWVLWLIGLTKDVHYDPVNLAEVLGSYRDGAGAVHLSSAFLILLFDSVFLMTFLFVLILPIVTWLLNIIAVLFAIAFAALWVLATSERCGRDRKYLLCVLVTYGLSYYMAFPMLYWYWYGIYVGLFLLLFPILWFLGWNRFLYGKVPVPYI